MGGGFVPGLAYSPVSQGLLYARTDVGGFYRWNNSAGQWVPLTDMYRGNNFGGESIAPDPVNPNVVYAAAGFSGPGTILRSTNQGDSWTANAIPVSIAGNNDGRNAGERLAVDPNLNSKLYFSSRWQGLWVSTNSAANWSQATSFPVSGDAGYGLSWVIFPPPTGGYGNPSGSASTTIYVGVMSLTSGNSNIYRSTNGGTGWNVISGGPSNMAALRASLGTDGNLWIVYAGGGYGPNGISTGQIWKLNTSTLAWTNVTPSGGPCNGCGGYGGISVDARNAQHAVITTLDWWGGPDRLFSTTNGGGSWSIIALSGSAYSVFNENGAAYQRGCNNGSGGAGWAACVAIDPFNSNNAIYTSGGAGGGGGVWSSTNIQSSPVSWTYTDNNLEETVAIYMNPAAVGGILFSCLGDVGGMRHTNVTQSPASGMYCNPQFSNTNMLDFAESRPNTVVRVGNSNNPSSVNNDVAYSTNNGQSWSPWGSAPPGYTTTGQMGSVAVAADGSRVVVAPYSGYGSPAYASSLGGSWTTCSGLPSGAMVASDRSNPSTFYATHPSQWVYGNSVTIYRSTNSGASFTQVNTIPVQWIDANGNGQWVIPRPVFGVPGEFWVSTYNALYRFTNAGSSVTAFSNVYEPMGPVGFGMAAPGQTHPAVFLVGTVNGTYGFFRCDDGVGTSWVRINDDNHQFNNPGWIQGDEAIYGRCYLGAGGRGILYGDISTSATNTPTRTATRTFTPNITATPTVTPTRTGTRTVTPTSTATRTVTPNVTATPTATLTTTATRTTTSTGTPTRTFSPPPSTATSTPARTITSTGTPTRTATNPPNTATLTATRTPTPVPPTATQTPTRTLTGTATPTRTATPNITPTPTPTASTTPTVTHTVTVTPTPSPSLTAPPSPTVTLTVTVTLSRTSSATRTPLPSSTPTSTRTASGTPTSTRTFTPAPNTPTPTYTGQPTNTSTATRTWTLTPSWTYTPQPTHTASSTPTRTPTFLSTNTPTFTSTRTNTPVPTITNTFTSTNTGTLTPMPTDTSSRTPSPVPTNTSTSTSTNTFTRTPTLTATRTYTPVPSATPTATVTFTFTHSATVISSPTLTLVPTDTATVNPSPTPTFSATSTRTSTRTFTQTPSSTTTPTASTTPTVTNTVTVTATPSPSFTATPLPTASASATRTMSPTPSPTTTPVPTDTPIPTATTTSTASVTPTFTNTCTITLTVTATEQPGIDKPIVYPNPSDGTQPMSIHIPGRTGTSDVTVQIFTVAFRLVQQQVFPQVPAGTDVRIDLKDKTGKPLASGLYYVVVTINGNKTIGKLLIMR